MNNAKIRASYGQIGNEAIGDYMFLERISSVSSGNVIWLNSGGTKVSMLNTPSLVSSELSWERIATTDIGLDLSFLNNSLNVTFDWFQRDTRDMLAPGMTLPAVLGASAPYANSGQLRTRGWELGISWNHKFGDVNVWASASVAFALNVYENNIYGVSVQADEDAKSTIVFKYNPVTKMKSTILRLRDEDPEAFTYLHFPILYTNIGKDNVRSCNLAQNKNFMFKRSASIPVVTLSPERKLVLVKPWLF